MPDWWPFGRKPQVDPEEAFRRAETELRQQLADRERNGESRQGLLHYVETTAKQLEQAEDSVENKARLRAHDLLYEELHEALLHNLREGKAQEMAGDVERAIGFYETAVSDQVSTRFPYEHLRVIYRRREEYDEALRICRAALDNPFLSDRDHDHFRHWSERLTARIT